MTTNDPTVLEFEPLPGLAPASLFAGALIVPIAGHRGAWTVARWATAAALVAAVASACVAPWFPSLAAATLPQQVLLVFVAMLGTVLVGYSARYLDGEPRASAFAGWLLAALGGAMFVLATDNLLLLALGWVTTSLALQQLLTFCPGRPWALIAAREKFLVARAADLLVMVATVLLASRAGTLHIGELHRLATGGALGSSEHWAVLLLAVAALLKCAQLPFHGWLLRVVESPTPVSALLHAGVVNLGGFVLLRMAPLLAEVPAATWLLVVVGGLTASIGALASSTQPSVKLALSWSTVAQMGFLMVQCGLGLWEMALLHLVAHSAYKAHAFLSAGSTVRRSAADAMARPMGLADGRSRVLALATAAGLVLGLVLLVVREPLADPAVLVGAIVLACGLAPLLEGVAPSARVVGRGLVLAVVCAGIWFALHSVLRPWLGLPVVTPTSWPLAITALACLAPLALVRLLVVVAPGHRVAVALHWFCQRGWFVDRWFTRCVFLTFWLSPFPARSHAVPDLTSASRGRGDL